MLIPPPPRIPLAALTLPVAVFSCWPSGDKPSGDDGDAGTSTGLASVGTAPPGNCTAVPDARRFHQMAWFFTDAGTGPISLTSAGGNPVWVDRGLLVYGGVDATTDALLSDLWLFDLTNGSVWDSTVAGASALHDESDPAHLDAGVYDYCRWHQLDSTGNPPLARGSMVYVPDLERFVVIGGWTESGGTGWSSAEVMALDLRDLEAGDTTLSTLGSGLPDATASWQVDAAQNVSGGALCEGYYAFTTYWDSDGDGTPESPLCTVTVEKCSGCVVGADSHTGSSCDGYLGTCDPVGGAYASCQDDPYCTDGEASSEELMSAPGLSEHAAAYDSAAGIVRVFGGVSGCTGTACGDWQYDSNHGQAGEEPERSTILNSVDFLVDPASGAVTTLGVDRDRYAPLPGEWPTEDLDSWPALATPGVHQLAVALTGLSWDRHARQWTGTSTGGFAKGGTRDAGLAPYQRFVLGSGIDDEELPGHCAYTSYCFQLPGDWLVVHAADGEDDGLVSATYGTSRVTLGPTDNDYGSHGLSSVSDAVRNAALVATDADRLLLIGGRNSSGATGDVVGITLGGDSQVILDVGSRYGAGAAWDPVMRTAYVFGGSADSSVRTVTYDDDPMARNSGSSFEMGLVQVDVQAPTSDPTGAWTLSAEFDVTHSCQDSEGGDECFTSWLPIYVPLRPGSSDLGTLQIELAFADGTVTTPMVADLDALEDHRAVRYDLRLPRGLEDGESVTVSVSYQAVPAEVERYQDAVAQERPVLQLFSHSGLSRDVLVGSLPAWAGTGEGWDNSARLLVEAEIVVDPPSGYAVTGNGQLLDPEATTGVQLYGAPAGRPRDHTVLMMEDLEYWGTYHWTGGEIDVFADIGIDWTGTAWSALEPYVETGLDVDLTYLEGILGILPRATPQLVLLREDPASDLRGHALHGTVLAFLVDVGGEDWAEGVSSATEAKTVLAHEWAHSWIGHHVRFEGETEWFGEGLCQMVAQSMYEELWATGPYGTAESTAWLRDRLRDGLSASLPALSDDPTVTAKLLYGVGSYVHLQAYLRYRATGASNSAYWAVVSSWLEALAEAGEASTSDLEGLFTTLTGSGAFYDTWVDGGVDALPLLGLTAFSHDDATSGTGTARVQQVQREMFPTWGGGDAVDGAPYLLACSPVGAPETQAFDLCISFTGEGAADPTPTTMSSDPVDLVLAELGPLGDPMPVTYTLLTGAHLHPTRLGIQPYRIDSLRRCRFGATDPPDCAIAEDPTSPGTCLESVYDYDGDCFPSEDDCDDGNANTHPLQVAGAEAPCSSGTGSPVVDHNCDGWTCE